MYYGVISIKTFWSLSTNCGFWRIKTWEEKDDPGPIIICRKTTQNPNCRRLVYIGRLQIVTVPNFDLLYGVYIGRVPKDTSSYIF